MTRTNGTFRRMWLWAGALLLSLLSCAVHAQEFNTQARFAVLMDYETGTVLFQKDADLPMEPASMAKLMTVAVVFHEIALGKLSFEDEFFISERAWREGGAQSGGSTMFAELNSKIKVADLVRSVIIQSGNDAAMALAEGIGGSEETFASMMNILAEQIGLTGSVFTNATGLPDPNMHVTARDLANLARYLIREYPDYYHIFSEPEFTWNKIRQENRNSLVEMGIGVDGLKTGHTEAAGYGSVVSTKQGGRRLVAVVHGLSSMRERAEEARKLITWGTRAFERLSVFPEGKTVGYADVYGGVTGSVPLVGKGNVDLYVPKGVKECPTATIVYRGPLRPPVEEGAQVAELRVFCGEQLVQTAPLFAGETVEQGDLPRRAMDALKQLAFGWL